MKVEPGSLKLILEEKKAIKLFLWLFYIFFISYDLFINFIVPNFTKNKPIGFPSRGLGFWSYVFVLGLLPIAINLIKKGNPYLVKYIFLFGFIFIDTVNNLMIYLGTTKTFTSGNIVELLFLIFSPVFVNKKYYWSVTIGIIGKYILIGMILHDKTTAFPIMVIVVIAFIAFILLNRFYSYIQSLNNLHNQLVQKEKLAVIGQMAAAIGHEIRNPLSSLKGFTQIQRERFPNTNDFYPIMIQEIDRINSIVNDLLYIGKPRSLQLEKVNIVEIINYTKSITHLQAEGQGVTIETIVENPIPLILCDSTQLKQVFINLIKNAIEAMPSGGQIIIHVKADHKEVNISILDEGIGIAPENIPVMGEPFFTTKKDGTGLGLMVTSQIVKDHRGTIQFLNNQNKGTTVEVLLPINNFFS